VSKGERKRRRKKEGRNFLLTGDPLRGAVCTAFIMALEKEERREKEKKEKKETDGSFLF